MPTRSSEKASESNPQRVDQALSAAMPDQVMSRLDQMDAWGSGVNTPDGARTSDPEAWAEDRMERTAMSLGKCGKCDLRGMDQASTYCSCEYGRERQLSHMRRLELRYDHAGVPDRLRGCTMASLKRESDEAHASDAAKATRDHDAGEGSRGLCILGTNGLGKSGLLTILAREAYKRGQVPLWIKYADLVRDGVQAGYS